MDEHRENFNKNIKNIKQNQPELKTTTTAMNNTLEGINSRLANAKEQISDFEDKAVKITQSKKKRKSEKCGGYKRHLGQEQVY